MIYDYKYQLMLIIATTVLIFLLSRPLATGFVYGGLVSWLNAWLINRQIKTQANHPEANAKKGLWMLISSVIARMVAVAFLMIAAFWGFGLGGLAVVSGFVLGQIGLILDTRCQVKI